MQGLRKGEWSAITQVHPVRYLLQDGVNTVRYVLSNGVKVFSPEICPVALGQGFHHLEASSAARDNGECVSDVPGSESMAGHSMIHSGTWDSHIVPTCACGYRTGAGNRSLHQAEEARRGYGGMAVGPVHIRGVGGVMPTESLCSLEGAGSKA